MLQRGAKKMQEKHALVQLVLRRALISVVKSISFFSAMRCFRRSRRGNDAEEHAAYGTSHGSS
jgi:hypothetical protein